MSPIGLKIPLATFGKIITQGSNGVCGIGDQRCGIRDHSPGNRDHKP